jgi:lysophospholipase L1-like esterase
MDYKLLILNFGINVVEAGKTDFTGYEKRMIRVINDLKKSFPETSIIIVGAGDKAVKKGSKLVSDKIVPRVVAVQEKIANQTGVAFWNMYEAMGSEGSMNNWVDEGLAARDYIHFSVEGGKIIADYLLNAIMKENKN